MAITASQVKELRERTGAGMMECKKALTATDGDMDLAIENMRKSGAAKADKKASRVAAEGVIAVASSADSKSAVMVEVNCETDFAAKDDNFKSFANAIADRILNSDVADVDALLAAPLHEGEDTTIEEARQALIAKIGENMNVRRFVRVASESLVASYQHGVRIAVAVELDGGNNELGRDVAMHIAASSPVCIDEAGVPADLLAKERDIVVDQAAQSGKPENIIEKMVEGRMRKYLGEITLVGQPFVKDPDMSVGKLLESKGATVTGFTRFEVGEGIEKKVENFREEVEAQAAAAANAE